MTQTERCLAILADGRWHAANEFYGAHLPNFRSRMSELGKEFGLRDKPLPDESWRFETRRHTYTGRDGESITANDWRDNTRDGEILSNLYAQLSAIREKGSAYVFFIGGWEIAVRPEDHETDRDLVHEVFAYYLQSGVPIGGFHAS